MRRSEFRLRAVKALGAERNPLADHDKTHKLFFNHRRLVHEFFLGYLPREWTDRMDFTTLEPVHASLIGRDLSERHGDQIWRVRWQAGTGQREEAGDGWFYFYLLLEFQSSPAPFMALRFLNYVGRLLESLVRQPQLVPGRRLPPVVPMMLYDGTRPWKGPLDLGSLFVPMPESVRPHLPQLRPLFVDESRSAPVDVARPEDPADNLAHLFFRVNTSGSPAELPGLAAAVDTRLPAAEEPELRQDFARLIARTLRRIFPGVTMPEVTTLEEITMVGQHMFEWTQKQLKEARTEGQLEGARRVLLDLLKLRFGALSLPVRRRVKAIQSASELRNLAGKVLVATSLAEMGLAEPAKPSAS